MKYFLLPTFLLGVSLSVTAAPTATETFKAKCAMCHGQDGAGTTPMGKKLKLKDLRGAEVQAKSDAELNESISKGKVPMPAYDKTLSPGEITDLVKYIRNIKQ